MSDGRVLNIVDFSDTHIGCKFGLCPPEGFVLDEGVRVGAYTADDPLAVMRRTVWGWWEEFWGDFVPRATRGEPFAIVCNGDAMDGNHHGSSTPFTANTHDQVLMAHQVYKPLIDICEGRFYLIRGTQVHVGESGRDEEALGQMLNAVPFRGRHSRWEMRARLGDRLLHFAHHIGTTTSPFAQSGALQRLAVRSYVETGRRGDPPYSLLARAHRHSHSEISEQAAHGKVTVLTTPAWQLKTPYVHSKDGLQMMQPEIGGVVIRLNDGELFTRAFVKRLAPEPEEII